MEETLQQELLAKTRRALDADDWESVVRLWEPWVEQGDAEAQYQLAYHYLWFTPCDDGATRDRMVALVEQAAAKDHPDAVWFLARQRLWSKRLGEIDPEADQMLLRAGRLGSMDAQRELGASYARGDWSGPQDLAEAVRWYRLAAEKGHADAQYNLGFMLLLGEGAPQNVEEGLMWLHRSGEQGESAAFRLLADCYENGYYDVPVNPEQAALWRAKEEEYRRLNPPRPSRSYAVECDLDPSLWSPFWEIDGVVGLVQGEKEITIRYDPALITPDRLDEKIRAAGIVAVPLEPT